MFLYKIPHFYRSWPGLLVQTERTCFNKPVDDVDIEIAMTRNDESSKLFEKSILAHLENAQI